MAKSEVLTPPAELLDPLINKYQEMYEKCQNQDEYKRLIEEDKRNRNKKDNSLSRKSLNLLLKMTN